MKIGKSCRERPKVFISLRVKIAEKFKPCVKRVFVNFSYSPVSKDGGILLLSYPLFCPSVRSFACYLSYF